MNEDWQKYFMGLAFEASKKSKDPSTKVGSVLVRPDKTVASLGFNGFPQRIFDELKILNDPEYREQKLKLMVHSEQNSLRFNRDNTSAGYVMFVTRHPCEMCALEIACSGIETIYYHRDPDFMERWSDSCESAARILGLAGIGLVEVR